MHLTIFSRPVAARASRIATHDRLGPAAHKTHHLNGRHGLDDFAGQLRFQFRRRTIARAPADRLRQSRHHPLVRVPDDQRPVAGDVVDIRIAINVLEDAPLRFPDENRRSANGFECPNRRGNPPGHHRASLLKCALRVHQRTFLAVGHVTEPGRAAPVRADTARLSLRGSDDPLLQSRTSPGFEQPPAPPPPRAASQSEIAFPNESWMR